MSDETPISRLERPNEPKTRRVWVATLPNGMPSMPPGSQVMIETFDGQAPWVAFRPDKWAVWGPPTESVEP